MSGLSTRYPGVLTPREIARRSGDPAQTGGFGDRWSFASFQRSLAPSINRAGAAPTAPPMAQEG